VGNVNEQRRVFLAAMFQHCAETGKDVHSLSTCWEIAEKCGLSFDGTEFKIAFMEPLLQQGKIMVRHKPLECTCYSH
jgi:predicted DsbA family dithiol-disulfide isomerase